jgi:hypothetical protein
VAGTRRRFNTSHTHLAPASVRRAVDNEERYLSGSSIPLLAAAGLDVHHLRREA